MAQRKEMQMLGKKKGQKHGRFLQQILVLFVMLSACVLSGCGKEEQEEENGEGYYKIYYLNSEETKLVPEEYKAENSSFYDLAEELLQAMDRVPKELSLRKVKPDDVVIRHVMTDKKGQITIDFGSGYKNMEAVREILFRAAVVKTLSQIHGVEFIQFYVEGQPLTDQTKKVVGFMSADNFIDNTGKETNCYQTVTMVLYFANKDGDKLREIHVTREYDATVTMEQFVIQQLLQGTDSIEGLDGGYRDTIPEGTRLIKTTTKEGISYIDFNSSFLNKREGLTDEAAIYSIVNSLVELSTVNKVQFTIDGVSVEKYGDGMQFDGIFERNLDIIE